MAVATEPVRRSPWTVFRQARAAPGWPIPLVIAAVTLFSISDVLAKSLSQELPTLEITWLRYLTFSGVAVVLSLRRGPSAFRAGRPGLQVLRGVTLLGSATLFILGLSRLGVAEATAVSFVTPAFITALSIPLLGEAVHVRRWTAVLVGLAGVLIVLRPGGEAFQPAALFPLGSALCGAVMVIITRKIGPQEGVETTLVWSALIGLILLSASSPLWWEPIPAARLAAAAALGVCYAAGQYLLVVAYTRAQASMLAPFTYAQLLSATLLGYLVFGRVPDAMTLAGMGVILLSGAYTLYREGVLGRGRRR